MKGDRLLFTRLLPLDTQIEDRKIKTIFSFILSPLPSLSLACNGQMESTAYIRQHKPRGLHIAPFVSSCSRFFFYLNLSLLSLPPACRQLAFDSAGQINSQTFGGH